MRKWQDSLHLDPHSRFSGMAENYNRSRPSYPDTLLDWMVSKAGIAPSAMIVDVGCGTGIATRQFAARNFDVVGIDPNEDMLDYAKKIGGARYKLGSAAETGLPDASADFVFAAQAFHWFDIPVAMKEFVRILKPGCGCAAFWNKRVGAGIMVEYDRVLHKYREHKEIIPGPDETAAAIKAFASVGSIQEASFSNKQELDKDGFFGRAYSASYVVHDIERREEFHRELAQVFHRFQQGGRVSLVFDSIVIFWRFATATDG